MKAALLVLTLCLSASAEEQKPKTDIAAPTANGTAVEANTTMSDQDASQRLQGHHIRDTHRVKIGSLDKAPDRPDKPLSPAPGSGMQASASAPPAGAPGAAGAAAAAPGQVAAPQGPDGPVSDAALNPTAKVMLGGTPVDFRSAQAKAVSFVGQAANSWTLGDFKGVILQTNQALSADPRNAQALTLQAMAYEKMRDYADSEADLRRSVAIDSADVKSWEHLAWAAYKQNKAQDALDAAQAALALDPKDAAALAIKAYAEDALGQRAQAAADIKAAAGLDPAFASRAARADGQDRLCAPEEELVDAAGGARRAKGGLPSWVPWIGGAMLVGLGLTMALISAMKGETPPSEPPQAA